MHCIVSSPNGNLSGTLRDLKSYSAKQIIAAIQDEPESRREWLELVLAYAARGTSRNKFHQVWQHDYHGVDIRTRPFLQQKMDYIHNNPVRAGLVREPQDYVYSSAADYYYHQQVGPIKTNLLELY
jgi:REP element-mobilizing transposase RayT